MGDFRQRRLGSQTGQRRLNPVYSTTCMLLKSCEFISGHMWKTGGPSSPAYASNGTEPGSQNALNLWITCERNVEIRPPRICEKQLFKKFCRHLRRTR